MCATMDSEYFIEKIKIDVQLRQEQFVISKTSAFYDSS